ncbi:hypothetical protein L1887_48879 [Cichorium endivia]|nr:hypothetical protein L1887_48879 [Cichorium endivia]
MSGYVVHMPTCGVSFATKGGWEPGPISRRCGVVRMTAALISATSTTDRRGASGDTSVVGAKFRRQIPLICATDPTADLQPTRLGPHPDSANNGVPALASLQRHRSTPSTRYCTLDLVQWFCRRNPELGGTTLAAAQRLHSDSVDVRGRGAPPRFCPRDEPDLFSFFLFSK